MARPLNDFGDDFGCFDPWTDLYRPGDNLRRYNDDSEYRENVPSENNDDSVDHEDDNYQYDSGLNDSVSIALPFAPVEANVCRFFTTRPGCNHGSACRDKHFSENGECLRCLQVVEFVDDLELHCLELCELRPSSETISDSQRFGTLGQSTNWPNTIWRADKVCHNHLRGCCKFGTRCKFLHLVDNKCVLCEDVVAANTLDQHLQTCTEYQILKSEMQKTKEVDCPICFCHLHEIPALDSSQHSITPTGDSSNDSRDEKSNLQESILPFTSDRFALLPDCCHLFCSECIQNWRRESQPSSAYDNQLYHTRCPICRREARFTVPCNRVIEGRKRCQREKEIFIHFKQLKPCENFQKGRCRLGSNCLNSHLGLDAI